MGARNLKFSAAVAASLATLSLSVPQAEALISNVTPSPAETKIASSGPASFVVNWNVQRQVVNPPLPGTVSSPNLRILIGGSVVATLPHPLTQSTAGEGVNETFRVRETVQIPQALVYRAVKEGHSLTVRRVFFDSTDNGFEDGDVLVTPSGKGSVALAVQRLELAFDDDTRSRVVPKGEELRVVAEIQTSGVGLLNVQWEVATGATTAGTPVFRALTRVRQGVGGGGRAVITSPPLPTSEGGTHLVRLQILEPEFMYDTPTLQYYVTPKRAAQVAAAPREILLTAPRPGEALSEETRFSWSAVAGADTYQLAFYAAPAGPADPLDPARDTQATADQMATKTLPAGATAIAGIFVPGERQSANLEAFSLAQLPSGKRYLWQVIAIDGNGAVIGTSSTREIHKP